MANKIAMKICETRMVSLWTVPENDLPGVREISTSRLQNTKLFQRYVLYVHLSTFIYLPPSYSAC